ncbi:MAG: hypothetical protein JNK81_12270 [Anaerolineales bacterium]|nr:hypothetical protein [Anaerolineales bacterium]
MVKEFWLRSAKETGFYCNCGVNRIMQNYYGADYVDYFVSLIRGSVTVDGLLQLAEKEYMVIESNELHKKLQAFDLNNLTERELYDVVEKVLTSNDVFRFRKELTQFVSAESILNAVAKRNPRVDVQGLRRYLNNLDFPLSEEEVIKMEETIERDYYHPEIVTEQ